MVDSAKRPVATQIDPTVNQKEIAVDIGFAIICLIVTVMLDILLQFVNQHHYHQEEVMMMGFGIHRVCKNKECIDAGYLNYDCTPRKCHEQGICNNKKNCHCNPSYLPPNCQINDDSWIGGSIDSGNFPPAPGLPKRSYIENAYHSKPTRWPFFLLIPFFIIFCVLIITLVKVYFQRKKWRAEDYTSDEQLESESEPKE
ncbi:disintegrin and metalloproteinase domain-containing protein 2-like [Ursus maritimus]|uniref:Disintegrin and metalloproteinase domain-containing protein 2-like n=1 Tax=Ursus maritimus TaxID=29073 RepID=A0A8M1GWA8_URSMA|nr:disintegrin and metalloproteinase domain-containing protein 2-like [Ursus maritimus]